MSLINDFQQLMQPTEEDCIPADPRFDVHLPPGRQTACEPDVVALMRIAHTSLVGEIISRIHAQSPEFFEYLVIDVLLAMGYGSRRTEMTQRLGRSGDGGIDGLIALDELGLDLIYIQAKRLRPGIPVPIGEIRDFAGSLEARHAGKGVFVTTTHFSPGATEFCARLTRRVVLLDGTRLAELMVRFNIGVKIEQSFFLKRIDGGYFTPARMPGNIPASAVRKPS
ncbi:restriction endonuclease [Aestuariivirga sp.]|uniref:restriction endonuclease n=1 Tax=Aestuariivirga sp. TaxID=2650926 RepID=UPI0035939F56